MKRKLSLVFMFALVSLLAGCGSMKAVVTHSKLSSEARYYDARKTFNDNVETYANIYDLATPERQVKWKAKIDPVIKIASNALDTWQTVLHTKEGPAKEELFKNIFRNLLTTLVAEGIVEVKQ